MGSRWRRQQLQELERRDSCTGFWSEVTPHPMTQGLSPLSWGSFQPSTQQLAPGGIPPGCRQMGRTDGEGSTREFSSRRARGGLSPKCLGRRMLMTERDTCWPCGRELAPAWPRYTSMEGTVVEPSLWEQETRVKSFPAEDKGRTGL